MYAWIFRHLPGPTWFKVIESLALIGAAVAALFTWVYPWVQSYLELGQSSVGGACAARFWKGRGRGHPGLVLYPRTSAGFPLSVSARPESGQRPRAQSASALRWMPEKGPRPRT